VVSPFAQVAASVIANGYSPIPIGVGTKYPARYEPAVSEDGREWWPLKHWQTFCTRQAHPLIIAQWSTWPDAGVGLATGFGGLVAVDIDDASLIEPLRAILPPILVGKRGRKGLTAFYRATEQLPSKNYRAEAGGLLDFLSDGKQTVLPPSVHSDTGRPYEWTTERTLLDTPLAELPAITSAHVAAIEGVLRGFGWEDSGRAQARGEAVARPARWQGEFTGDDELTTTATASRAQWLPLLGLHRLDRVSGGWRAVASFRQSGSGAPLHKRGLSLSIRDDGSIFDHGTGTGYNNVTLVAECLFGGDNVRAVEWLRDQLGLPDAPLITLRNGSGSVVEPSYTDRRAPLAEAEAAVASLVREKFEQSILEWRAVRNQIVLKPLLALRSQPVTVARIEAGIGKTRAAVEAVAVQARRRLRVVYVVQRHDLADAVATQFAAQGIKAEVYRGYDRPDPLAPGHAMCRNIPAYEAARDLGVGIRAAVCERRIEERIVSCRFADVCGRERQREAQPQVWIVPAALLPLERPDYVFDGGPDGTPLDAIVIDERFHDQSFGKPQAVAIPTLARLKIEGCDPDEAEFLTDMRRRLLAATEANGDGPLSRAALDAQGIRPDSALRASYLEQRVCTSKLLRPAMSEVELKTAAYKHGPRTRIARTAGILWEEIALFLAFDHPQSGRLSVLGDKITVTALRSVHPSWQAPTLVLDATAPDAAILTPVIFGDEVSDWPSPRIETTDIAAHWPDHVRVRQIVAAPVGMAKLGLWDGPRPQNEADVLRFIRLRASLAAPAMVGLITYKGFLDKIADKLLANVIVKHFGALSGMNDMQDVAGLIVIGRPAPKRAAVEADASVLAGYPVGGGGHHFEQIAGGIRLAYGGAIGTVASRHPDALAEALRWQVTEAELLQAIGRIRPHRRGAPTWVDIVCDTPLPVPVDEVVAWEKPSPVADMVALGVVLTNRRDGMKAFGLSDWGARGWVGFSKESLFRDSTPTSAVRSFTYKKAGPGQKINEGVFLPHVMKGGEAALRAWLEGRRRFGPLASLNVERVKPQPAVFEKIGRDAVDFASRLVQAASAESSDGHGNADDDLARAD
jgi:hypothetical protein